LFVFLAAFIGWVGLHSCRAYRTDS